MPNSYDQRKLMDRLVQDKDAELMPNEINSILEKELSKPADEVDMQLVNELLELLGEEEPNAADKEASWQIIQQERKPKKRFNWRKTINRAAAIAAAIVVVFFVSFESAKAFRWTFLLKLLTPVAETFGIYSTSTIESEEPAVQNALVIEDTGYEQVTYDSIEQMPAEVGGYRIIPTWVPDRFGFRQGTIYEDPDMVYCTLSYRDDEDTIRVNTCIYYNSDSVFSYVYERTLTEPKIEEENGIFVSYYYNNIDEDISSASWIDSEAHYQMEGNITDAELRQIVRSMIE